MQEFVLKKLLMKKKVEGHIGKAELKITMLTVYITSISVIGTVSFVYFDANASFREDLAKYILCESTGTSQDCALDTTVADTLYILRAVANMMLASVPVLAFLINCNPKHCKRMFEKDKKNTCLPRVFSRCQV